jgi:flagellar biosynthesis protein FlhF
MMHVKRYIAPTYAEALIQAKNELGTEAMIVESKKVKIGGLFGLFGRTVTELTMAVDSPAGAKPPAAGRTRGYGAPALPPAPAESIAAAIPAGIERELSALRTAVARLAERTAGDSGALKLQGYGRFVYESLLTRGVDEAAALDIGQRVGDEGPAGHRVLAEELGRLLGPGRPTAVQPGQRQVLALIGPTGVGKTTTLAKLAAHFGLEKGLKVGLITSDTYRIAAIEQLRTYADILGQPLHPVDTPEDVARAVRETADCDVVLVDTGGRNHRDAKSMTELRDILAVLRPDETHLVCSLTTNPRDTFEALEHYLPLGVNRLTFTKLDEAAAPGILLNVRMRCKQPLGYITCGQSVPEDIIPADRADFTKILLGA